MSEPAAATAALRAAAATCWSATAAVPPLPMPLSSCLVTMLGSTPSRSIARCSSMPLSLGDRGTILSVKQLDASLQLTDQSRLGIATKRLN